MENKEFIKIVLEADAALRALYNALITKFNTSDVDYAIEFEKKSFEIYQPSDKEEKKRCDKEKHTLAVYLIKDMFKRLVKTLNQQPTDKVQSAIWGIFTALQVFKSKEVRVSNIVSEEYNVPDEGPSRPLNTASMWVQLQRKDLSEAEKSKLLYRIVNEPYEGKSDHG